MLTVTRAVYYCEFCNRHYLSKGAATRHEPKCIKNPDRSACGWHSGCPRPADFTERLHEDFDLDWLREEIGGCPACMLAVVVQADLDDDDRWAFVYKDEVARYQKDEREDASYAY